MAAQGPTKLTTTAAALAATPLQLSVEIKNAAGPSGCFSALGFIKSTHQEAPRNKKLFDYARLHLAAGRNIICTLGPAPWAATLHSHHRLMPWGERLLARLVAALNDQPRLPEVRGPVEAVLTDARRSLVETLHTINQRVHVSVGQPVEPEVDTLIPFGRQEELVSRTSIP